MSVVHKHFIELILEERDKNEKEIYKEAIEEFKFPKEDLSEIKIQLLMEERNGYIKKLENGKYHLLKIDEDPTIGRKKFLELLNKASENYFEERPWIRKLKKALEEKF
jgi:hypothetical protein